jgi:hypothetical protein
MLPHSKAAIAIVPISKTNGATATGEAIDRLGFDYVEIDIIASTADVVSNTLSVLKLQESATTDATNFADISAGGTQFTIATNAYTSAASQNIWSFKVDGRGRKRYLRVLASPQTTMVIGGTAKLFRAKQALVTAAGQGALNVVNVPVTP